MEVITAHFNQVKKLCEKYRQDPHSFSTEELAYSLERLQELPVKPLFDRFHPMVQELANKYGKKIHFEVIGEELAIHREKFSLLSDTFVHLIRNAIDHAIEPVEERKRMGKEEIGRITVECSTDRHSVTFIITDDGRGINPEEVGTKALSRGLVSQKELDQQDINGKRNLIFLQGMSTKTEINEISGRGLGLDVVKVNVTLLSGVIDVSSEVGSGTKFTIVLRQGPKLVALNAKSVA